MRQNQAPALAPLRSSSSLEQIQAKLGPPIDPSTILVVVKRTRIERDMELSGRSFNDVVARYKADGEDTTETIASHEEQLATRAKIISLLSPSQVRFREKFTNEELNQAALVIALGGDNHFQAIAHRIAGNTPILGVSSDKRSYGALLSGRAHEFELILKKLKEGNYQLHPWTTLDVEVNGKKLPPALCDVLLSERDRSEMSRHLLKLHAPDGKALFNTDVDPVSQKSSGLLIATGAGSNNRAWASAASRFIFPDGLSFPKSTPKAVFIHTEASNTHPGVTEESKELPPLTAGDLVSGEELVATSLNDTEGVVTVDSQERLPFPRGAKAVVKISNHVQWVAVPFHENTK